MPNTVTLNQSLPTITNSLNLLRRAQGLIPACTQTLAKGPTQYVAGAAPVYLKRGRGSRVWDVDENEYLDLTMAVGPLVLGYCYPAVDHAIAEQLQDGITFSLMHPLEVEVAESIRACVPGAERVRFSKTGADVTSAAIRLARAFTGRERVLCAGYHGWHDWYIGTTSRAHGVPRAVSELTSSITYNDEGQSLAAIDETIAAVILEPTLFEEPRGDYLRKLRLACERAGALLVFDEMWTGFRLALGGAQQHFDVRADLACFSKAVANGMPLSVLTGRADVMDLLEQDVFFFTTFGGEALSLAAANATLLELRERAVCSVIAARGERLKRALDALLTSKGLQHVSAVGFGCRTMLRFGAQGGDPLEQKSLVQQELLKHGVLWTGFHNLSFSHEDADIEYVLSAYDRALDVLRVAIAHGDLQSRIQGRPVEPVFRTIR